MIDATKNGDEEEQSDEGFAMASVHRAEFVVKIMAVLQNPSKVAVHGDHDDEEWCCCR